MVRYIQTQVGQDIKRRVTVCFTAVDPQGRVAGSYTLAKKLPCCPNVPAVRMGGLAVDKALKGRGLGAALLADALRRAATAEIAAYAFVVDEEDGHAADCYAHHGFHARSATPC